MVLHGSVLRCRNFDLEFLGLSLPRSASFSKKFQLNHFLKFILIAGGGEKARQRHISRGKLLPRDRITKLLDPE